ncbi:uncharacterized protein LOC141852157 [Brevipalpus obovatus]|uniref:uncharacterized protein LOC141852157 n=1 Tax=Brevipalpus obovatus TaxID=246614 RepID=UPI003D9E148B
MLNWNIFHYFHHHDDWNVGIQQQQQQQQQQFFIHSIFTQLHSYLLLFTLLLNSLTVNSVAITGHPHQPHASVNNNNINNRTFNINDFVTNVSVDSSSIKEYLVKPPDQSIDQKGKIIVTTTATSAELTSSKQELEESVAKLVNNISHNVHLERRNTHGQQNSHDRYENVSENINYITTTTTTSDTTSNKLQNPLTGNTSVPLSSTSPSPSSSNSVDSFQLDSTSLLPTIYSTNYTGTQFEENNLSTTTTPLPYKNNNNNDKNISTVNENFSPSSRVSSNSTHPTWPSPLSINYNDDYNQHSNKIVTFNVNTSILSSTPIRLNVKRDLSSNNHHYHSSRYSSIRDNYKHINMTSKPTCPNITLNARLKCSKNLDKPYCACYRQSYDKWLNGTAIDSNHAFKAFCCSWMEIRNCVEQIFRSERPECEKRWHKEAKRYADLVITGVREAQCRDYRKPEQCRQGVINMTSIAIMIIVAIVILIACVGYGGYACYRRHSE